MEKTMGFPAVTLAVMLGMLLCSRAEAQQVKHVGVLYYGVPSASADLQALVDRLRDLGWTQGRNITFHLRYAEGRTERFAELAADLVRQKPDLIVAVSTPGALAAKNATTTIPIVILAASDPVGAGIVPSLARPGGNITGLSLLAPELSAKRVDLLRQTLPKLTRLAVLWNIQNQGMHLRFREISTAAPPLGIHVLSFGVRHPSEFEEAFAAIRRDHPEALLVMADTVTVGHRHRTVEFADAHRIPAIYESREFVDAGGLMSYGINFVDHYRQGAAYVDRILKGQRPADLAIEQPSRFELVVNQRSARAIGLTIPASLLLRADQVIE
jgi:putative ABC transport system substrate-binding protein